MQGNGGQQVAISPNGSIFVATDRGLFRSTDNGASFVDVDLPTNAAGTAPFTGSAVGSWTSDVKVRPGHPDDIYAAVGYVAGKIRLNGGLVTAPTATGTGPVTSQLPWTGLNVALSAAGLLVLLAAALTRGRRTV